MVRKDITYEILYDMLINKKMNMKEISISLGCGYNTVRRRMIKYGIKTSKGYEGTRIHNSWRNMKASCLYETQSNYKSIGAKGIKYDEGWENFSGFYEDMKDGYKETLFLTRKDREGNFTKENCFWGSRDDILYGGEHNIPITIDGSIYTTKEAANILEIKQSTLINRYYKGMRGDELISPVLDNYITNIPHMNDFYKNGGEFASREYVGFNNDKKELIRARDNYICQECGIHNDYSVEKFGHSLHVHHIDYDKKNSNECNLISLCPRCHGKTNIYNREMWYKRYKNKISQILTT